MISSGHIDVLRDTTADIAELITLLGCLELERNVVSCPSKGYISYNIELPRSCQRCTLRQKLRVRHQRTAHLQTSQDFQQVHSNRLWTMRKDQQCDRCITWLSDQTAQSWRKNLFQTKLKSSRSWCETVFAAIRWSTGARLDSANWKYRFRLTSATVQFGCSGIFPLLVHQQFSIRKKQLRLP